MNRILLLIALLNITLFADFKSVGIEEFEKLQAKGLPIIDIRTSEEWEDTGIIEGAYTITFFNEQEQPLLADWFFKLGHLIHDKSEPFIIYCAHSSRSQTLGEGLLNMGFENVYELKDGIKNGWINKGKKIVKK